MKKTLLLLTTSVIALAACKKEIRSAVTIASQEQTLTAIFKANNIDCKSCASYADSIAHNGFIVNPAVFCKNYCEYVKRIK
jgi:hypothetical protein